MVGVLLMERESMRGGGVSPVAVVVVVVCDAAAEAGDEDCERGSPSKYRESSRSGPSRSPHHFIHSLGPVVGRELTSY